jgi:hypothetical protein
MVHGSGRARRNQSQRKENSEEHDGTKAFSTARGKLRTKESAILPEKQTASGNGVEVADMEKGF